MHPPSAPNARPRQISPRTEVRRVWHTARPNPTSHPPPIVIPANTATQHKTPVATFHPHFLMGRTRQHHIPLHTAPPLLVIPAKGGPRACTQNVTTRYLSFTTPPPTPSPPPTRRRYLVPFLHDHRATKLAGPTNRRTPTKTHSEVLLTATFVNIESHPLSSLIFLL